MLKRLSFIAAFPRLRRYTPACLPACCANKHPLSSEYYPNKELSTSRGCWVRCMVCGVRRVLTS